MPAPNNRDMILPSNPLIAASELASNQPFRLLYVPDANERPEGMSVVPIRDWTEHAASTASGFDDPAFWQAQIAALGVGPDALSVVLDDGRMTEAARVWFILQYFGLPAAVLNGGIGALEQVPDQVPPCEAEVHLRPGTGKVGLRERHGLKADLPRVQVFDARTEAEFRGEDLKGNPRGGHLPGSAHLSHADLLDGTRLRPVSEVAPLLDAAGLDGSRQVVCMCNGGGRAALAALAALAAGRENVAVYYRSFADWAADESCPITQPG